jgi:hypothetical protein
LLFIFMLSTTPGWRSGKHVSSDRIVLCSILNKTSWDLQALHSKVHYGDSKV